VLGDTDEGNVEKDISLHKRSSFIRVINLGGAMNRKPSPEQERKRGRPPRYGARQKQLSVYLPPVLAAGLRRFSAHEEAEGRPRPKPSDIVVAALTAYPPLRKFLREKALVVRVAISKGKN
jgi:hypothetical protein